MDIGTWRLSDKLLPHLGLTFDLTVKHNSNEPKVVPVTNTTADTFALDVVKNLTELIPVLKHRKLEALTPYHPEVWECKL